MRLAPSTNGHRITECTKKNGLRVGGRSSNSTRLLTVTVDDDLAVTIVVAVVTTLDHDGLVAVAITVLSLTDHFTVANTIALATAHGNANTCPANADTEFFRTRRHRDGNSSHRDGSHYKMLNHRMFLSIKLPGVQFAEM
jgi:hypothetical protein